MSDTLMRRMREHVGYDPEEVARHPEQYNRAERRAAMRALAEQAARAESK